ncbi:hypothetical protein INT48_003345 [Thamnidium elegans]|uniref:Zinc finger PHD-type domain-containing protein n=1 Tax=Thamnidium elegans TaxID=101142 RepID=A0A8H7SKY8_9FUNG|nr:hypothetical protein INT48_003345 [Thamnidium elegans]
MSYSRHYSVYRPAYHRIPSTPAIAPRQSSKDVWASMSPEVSPIVVPSMSAATLDFYQSTVASNYGYQQYYRQPVVQSSSYHQMHHIPIHHTLENATITYDTVEQDFQKDLVKDVFFSPAMIHGREMSPDSTSSASSTCAQSDNESDPATPPRETFSPHETPSDLLMLDDNVHLFDFGLDLATTSNNSTQTTTSSYEEVIMMAKKKPAFTLSLNTKKFDFSNCLPTPPANDFFFPQQQKNKRRCSDSVLQDRLKKKQRVSSAHLRAFASPPTSPRIQSTLKNETIFETHCDYFEDASAPVKYTPKKHKKTILMQSNNTIVHPLCNNNKKKPFEQVVDHPPVLCDDTSNVSPRPTATPTIYQKLTKASIDWCRYCGTTEGVNWRPGPWGKRTLCNKHGCDYKGYGFACKLPRLDLTAFTRESIDDRERPVLQLYCSGCQRKDSWESNVLVRCEGCPKAFHQNCCPTAGELTDAFVNSKEAWFCDASCCENTRRKRIVVELPRKRLPLMCAPKSNALASSVSSESSCRPRTLRESSISSTR